MIFTKPSVELINQEDLYKHIELCGRTCYHSQDKITNDSAKKFVDTLIKSNHLSVLEHGTIYLSLDMTSRDRYFKYCYNKYSKTCSIGSANEGTWEGFVTTNLRVLIENGWMEDLQYISEPTKHPRRITVRFTCGIDISREINRHRCNSVSEQSTRYCNYSLGKFENSIHVITNEDINEDSISSCLTSWDSDDSDQQYILETMCYGIYNDRTSHWDVIDTWLFANLAAEWSYMKLISLGWKPQQARRILPLDTETELIHTAFLSDWEHFLALRSPKHGATGVHPDAAYLANELKDLLNEYVKHLQ